MSRVSLLRLPFGPNNVWAAARFWAHGIRRGREAAERFPDRTLTVRYEDLCADPKAVADRLCGFLGLGFDEDMLAIEQTDPAKLDQDKAAWFTGLEQGINASAVGRWRSELSPHEQALFAAVAGPELEAAGYEPGPAQEPTTGRVRALPGAGHGHEGRQLRASATRRRARPRSAVRARAKARPGAKRVPTAFSQTAGTPKRR